MCLDTHPQDDWFRNQPNRNRRWGPLRRRKIVDLCAPFINVHALPRQFNTEYAGDFRSPELVRKHFIDMAVTCVV